MRKIIKISFESPNKIICLFDNGKERLLDLASTIQGQYANKILSDETIFRSAQIGSFGEIYWAGIAEITGTDKKKETCDYDISPEFAYVNSEAVVSSQ